MCRKPFQSFGNKICRACTDQVEEDFIKIKEYLYDHKGNITVSELAEKTEVPKKTILFLLEEKRIEIAAPDSEGALLCKVCRRPITSGTMCKKCEKALEKDLKSALPPSSEPAKKDPLPTKKGAKMHIDRDK